jgi:hypothetical protein
MSRSTGYSKVYERFSRFGNIKESYKCAFWLRSDFDENVWICRFGEKRSLIIDFNITLQNGTSLTSGENETLLMTIKYWLTIQTHEIATGGREVSDLTSYIRVAETLKVIDHILLNESTYQITKYGFGSLIDNDLIAIVIKRAESHSYLTSLYDFNNRLSAFLREKIEASDIAELDSLITNNSFLSEDIPDLEDRRLTDLTDEELIYARAWLWKNGFYHLKPSFSHKLPLKIMKVIDQLFRNTLYTIGGNLRVLELNLKAEESHKREFERCLVRNAIGGRAIKRNINKTIAVIQKLGLLAEIPLQVPSSALLKIDEKTNAYLIQYKKCGRYKTLPLQSVFTITKQSIEFILDFGKPIVDSYVKLVAASIQHKCSAYELGQTSISLYLDEKLQELNVAAFTCDSTKAISTATGFTKSDYFHRFRNAPGLYELIRVLFGSIQIIVGVLSARRNGELFDLLIGSCVDRGRRHLIFDNRKSGFNEYRSVETRPISQICIHGIELLEYLNSELKSLNILNSSNRLFAYPSKFNNSFMQCSTQDYLNRSLDFACDYFETPIIGQQRMYFRQHQFRRFFAMVFFWKSSTPFAMDVLRWFLGHTDPEHLYNYITENTPGAVLNSVKCELAFHRMKNSEPETAELGNLMESRFGTRDFSILDENEALDYLEYLSDIGEIKIEPIFFGEGVNRDYEIGVRIRKLSHG